ncbi:hypothetical protein [Bradyrhizobium prioriisuperbiae]|uniref:hypothetical protein n=1 Tax=Bradyrhizobium prioriisuperbiae TaxID=2854389 RepID=UPI0028E84F0D|nr:hypothetical protein [Bradyrhizobium prioritasuperba]
MNVSDAGRSLYVAAGLGGLITGVLTPFMQLLVIRTQLSGNHALVLLALPFAVLVMGLLHATRSPPWWALVTAALVTTVAFVAAVSAAVFVVELPSGLPKVVRYMLAGIAGGLVGTSIMAIGLRLLPLGRAGLRAWLPMLAIGVVVGILLAVDILIKVPLVSVLYPVWQAGVAIGLVKGLCSDRPVSFAVA